METQPEKVTPILEVAWMRFAQLDAASLRRSRSHLSMRKWIATFGILATLFAILTGIFPKNSLGELILKVLLILMPLLASGLAAFVSKFYSTGDWLVTRAGAEEVLKEIYAYRTILQNTPTRRAWLEKRLEEIQRSVFSGMNGELILDPYKGPLPPFPRFSPTYTNSDPGFHDLTGDEYFRFRLEDQLNWHTREVNRRQRERTRLQALIIISGLLGAFLAAWGPPLALLVALSAAFTSAFIGWQELRSLDSIVRNYSKVIMELNILFDHWKNLEGEEQNQTEFYKMVRSAEDILWGQNVEYIKSMQEALRDNDLEEEASLVNRVIKEQRDSDLRLKQGMSDAIVDFTHEILLETEETLTETFKSALGTLSEEASSELVQAELADMQRAIRETAKNIAERTGISSSLQAIQDEFDGVEINGNTPVSVLNDMMSRLPKTTDAKG